MSPVAPTLASQPIRRVTTIDLTDEERLLAEDRVEYDVAGVRALLAALELGPAGETRAVRRADVVDLSIYRATGSRHLATLFSR